MADKKITDLTLRSNVNDDVNIPVDDGVQTYRVTGPQVSAYVSLKKVEPVVSKTSTYNVSFDDSVLFVDSSGGAVTLNLPAVATKTGKVYTIQKTDSSANGVIIDPNSTEQINGATTFTLYGQNDTIKIISNGTAWIIIGKKFNTPILKSSQVTTAGSGLSATSFTTFDNSPAFTFTPTVSGLYKVYSNPPLENTSTTYNGNFRIANTSGGGTLIAESPGSSYNNAGVNVVSGLIQSVFRLTAGTSYVFDIQGNANNGANTVYINGSYIGFYMFAEFCGE